MEENGEIIPKSPLEPQALKLPTLPFIFGWAIRALRTLSLSDGALL
jgi:hypothetical protein